MAKICNSKPVKIVLIVAIIILAIVFGFVFYQKMSDENEEKAANAPDDVSYDVPDASDIKVKKGRYYLNGDTNSYYFEITAGNHIQLHCDDMYALFEKWNPGKDDIIKEDVAYWTGEKEYKIVVTEIGTVILAVEWEYDDNSNLTGLTSGPCWLDENTLGKWGQEGDFKYVDSSEYADSSTAETVDTSYTIAIEDKIYHLSNKVLSAEEKAYIDKQAADASSTRYLYDPAQQADGAITDVKADVFRLDSKYLCIKIKCDDLYRSVQKIYTDKNGIDGNETAYVVLEPAGSNYTLADSLPDSTEISAYYIYHWYGEEPYEITDKDTIDKITAWIENAKSVCKDYPYIDGAEYGGADAYGISLEKDESSDAYESICVIDVSQYSWDTSGGMHSESKIYNFSIKDDTGEFQEYNLPKEMIDEIMPLITRPNVE